MEGANSTNIVETWLLPRKPLRDEEEPVFLVYGQLLYPNGLFQVMDRVFQKASMRAEKLLLFLLLLSPTCPHV